MRLTLHTSVAPGVAPKVALRPYSGGGSAGSNPAGGTKRPGHAGWATLGAIVMRADLRIRHREAGAEVALTVTHAKTVAALVRAIFHRFSINLCSRAHCVGRPRAHIDQPDACPIKLLGYMRPPTGGAVGF